jgi:rubredoxin
MIRIDITTLIFIYILFSVIVIFIIWVILGYKRFKGITPDQKHIENAWKCSICFYTYIDSLHDDISICPLCGSYNKRDEHLH